MIYLRMGLQALSAAGLLTKLLVAAGLVTALLAAYGVWHHQVYSKGWNAAVTAIAVGDKKAVGQASAERVVVNGCRAKGQSYDQVTGGCR